MDKLEIAQRILSNQCIECGRDDPYHDLMCSRLLFNPNDDTIKIMRTLNNKNNPVVTTSLNKQ